MCHKYHDNYVKGPVLEKWAKQGKKSNLPS